MLKQILTAIEQAGPAMNLTDLSRSLGITPGALNGMLEFLVQKGKLSEENGSQAAAGKPCSTMVCSGCPGVENCPLVMKMPRRFSLPTQKPVSKKRP